jgi:aminoglycoside phosphotransferase (APT) family kinase protein
VTGSAPADAVAVREGENLDWRALGVYLRSKFPRLDGRMEVLQFPNGAANLTYKVRFGELTLVVRRPPFGRIAPGAHDMTREWRTLSRLWRCYDRAPRALDLCEDTGVIGAPFLVMEYRSGVGVWGRVPKSMEHHPDAGRRIGLAVVDARKAFWNASWRAGGPAGHSSRRLIATM